MLSVSQTSVASSPRGGGLRLLSVVLLLTLIGCSSSAPPVPRTPQIGTLAVSALDSARPAVRLRAASSGVAFDAPTATQPLMRLPAEKFGELTVHDGQINALAVTTDGSIAFTAGNDGRVVAIRQLDERTVEVDEILKGSKPVTALSMSPNEQLLAVAEFSSVVIFDIGRRKVVNRMTQVRGRVSALSWDPEGALLAIGMSNGDVYIWTLQGGQYAGQNSLQAIESYEAAESKIVSLVFHPSGGAFFAGAESGDISLWRLLRTERDIGLRDTDAAIDEQLRGSVSEDVDLRFKRTQQNYLVRTRARKDEYRYEDLWLNRDASVLYAASSDGLIYRWKVRGLVQLSEIIASGEIVFSITGLSVPGTATGAGQIVVSSGREARIKLFCASPDRPKLLAETTLFRTPVSAVRAGSAGRTLWAAQKTGNLLVFNANSLFTPGFLADYEIHCTG